VGFGALADIIGRKKMYGLELILIIAATLAQCLTGTGPGVSIVGLLIFWRVLMGIGMSCSGRTVPVFHANEHQELAVTIPSLLSLRQSSPLPNGEGP
jgi:MFS family permease